MKTLYLAVEIPDTRFSLENVDLPTESQFKISKLFIAGNEFCGGDRS